MRNHNRNLCIIVAGIVTFVNWVTARTARTAKEIEVGRAYHDSYYSYEVAKVAQIEMMIEQAWELGSVEQSVLVKFQLCLDEIKKGQSENSR